MGEKRKTTVYFGGEAHEQWTERGLEVSYSGRTPAVAVFDGDTLTAEAPEPGRAGDVKAGYNEELSHRVYAGADMLLMPSRFEPCGLSQMIAMRYGTLPIVRETGGLKDTVKPYNQYTGEGNGFSFANYNAHEMKATVEMAVNVYRNQPDAWAKLMRNAMSEDFSFARSAEDYARLYIDML